MAETEPSLVSCISSATPSLQLDLRDAQEDYNAHIRSEWERQLGFRVRAAQNSVTRLSR